MDLSLGASHAIAQTSDGAVYAWGTHERAQISRPVPQVLQVLSPSFKAQGTTQTNSDSVTLEIRMRFHCSLVVGASSGPTQILVWSEENPRDLPSSMPFVIDLSENTFK